MTFLSSNFSASASYAMGIFSVLALIAAIVVVVVLMKKYTEQKKMLKAAETSLATQGNLRTMIFSLPIPIKVIDIKRSLILYVNDAFVKLYGYGDNMELRGKSIYDITAEIQTDGVTATDKYNAIYEADGPIQTEFTAKTKQGKLLDILVLSCYIEFEGAPCTIGIIKDLSAEKKSNVILFNAFKKEKEENLVKTNILEVLSGGMRTSAMEINLIAENNITENTSPELLEALKKIHSISFSLMEIIDDSKCLTDIELSRLNLVLEEFELDDVLSIALNLARHFADKGENDLLLHAALDLPKYVWGDKMRVLQIITSFLDNSARYTESGKIVFSVSIDNEKSDEADVYIIFMIKDTGTGDDRSRSLSTDGSDFIKNHAILAANKLCAKMGGEISVELTQQGALIRFTIPFKRSKNKITTKQYINTPELSGMNVLVADGDGLSLRIMERLLKSSNVNCHLAKSWGEAENTAQRLFEKGDSLDLVLLDYGQQENGEHLPKIAEVLKSFRKAPKIIMLIPNQTKTPDEQLYLKYADSIIKKPFVPSKFISVVRSTLKQENAANAPSEADTQKNKTSAGASPSQEVLADTLNRR
ncbi:MAG: PAS domain S-box protein [Clostridiales bacterium]|jgi:PAS domain S-box-containing protein|nr:PAS domain S-box protein [Clostridiales bacterium]